MAKSNMCGRGNGNGDELPNKKLKRDPPDEPDAPHAPEGQGQRKKTTPKKDDKKKMLIFQKRRLTPDFKQLRMIRLCVVPSRQQRVNRW